MAISAVLAVAAMWTGLTLSYMIDRLPPSTAVILVAAAIYLVAAGARAWSTARPRWRPNARRRSRQPV
jgi:zinc/manganese transport system permease protein